MIDKIFELTINSLIGKKIFKNIEKDNLKMVDQNKFDQLYRLLEKLDQDIEFWHLSEKKNPVSIEHVVH